MHAEKVKLYKKHAQTHAANNKVTVKFIEAFAVTTCAKTVRDVSRRFRKYSVVYLKLRLARVSRRQLSTVRGLYRKTQTAFTRIFFSFFVSFLLLFVVLVAFVRDDIIRLSVYRRRRRSHCRNLSATTGRRGYRFCARGRPKNQYGGGKKKKYINIHDRFAHKTWNRIET